MHRLSLGTTRRGREPLQHAVAQPWQRTSRTGRLYRAVCGAAVYIKAHLAFDPSHKRACRKCRKEATP